MTPFESTRRLLTAFSFGSPALTRSADAFDHLPPTTSEGHQVTYSLELEPWPTKPRHSEDSDLSSSSSSSSSSLSSPAAPSSAQDSGAFADRLAELPSYQPRQRFPTPSIRSGIRRTNSICSNASSIISTRSSDAVESRRAQRRASEDAWRQFWD